MKSFKNFLIEKEKKLFEQTEENWKKEYVNLQKGFVPPSNLKPIIQAFLDSGSIPLINDTSSKITMPKKSLFLVGGSVRDFILGKRHKDLDLVTSATPDQIAMILHSAGFKLDKSNHDEDLKLLFEPEMADENYPKKWYLKEKDLDTPTAIYAMVNGEEFKISTFRKNSNEKVEFTDNLKEDSERRDLTINSLYIELTKTDGENNKLYDPNGHGYYDLKNNKIRVIGNPKNRFEEDKSRIMRAIRFQSKFGKEQLSKDTEQAIRKMNDLDGMSLEKIKQEFIKGIEDPDVDPKKYINNYNQYGVLNKIFPEVSLNTKIPSQLRDKKDKFLTLAWILQDNPIEKINSVLDCKRKLGEEEKETGWKNQEKQSVVFLLRLKEFDLDEIEDLLKQKKILGITKDQIRKWVELFDLVDENKVVTPRPNWARKVKSFAGFSPDYSKLVTWNLKDKDGNLTNELHPEIISNNLSDVPSIFRNSMLKDLNKKKLREMFHDYMKHYTV